MDKTDFVSIFVLLMLTIMLPEIVTGDKVVYDNEHEGVVTNIESPLWISAIYSETTKWIDQNLCSLSNSKNW